MKNVNKKDFEILNKNIQKLNKLLYRNVSLKWNLIKSIVSGVGYTIGATIIFGILIAILSKTIHTVEDVPILNKIVNTIKIEKVIEGK